MRSMRVKRLLGYLSALFLLTVAASAQELVTGGPGKKEVPEVRFLTFAPSSYTKRFDSVRAGLGIALHLKRLGDENALPVRIGFINGVPALRNEGEARALLRGAPVLVIGGSTWSQGSSAPLRRFFEITGSESLWGISASVWATAGGSHTGGEMVVQDSMRSLMGMGAQTFTLGQKLMVFSTDERIGGSPGEFTLLDSWYVEQFAKVLLLQAHARGDPAMAREIARKLKLTHAYYFGHPKTDEELVPRHREHVQLINTALEAKSLETIAARIGLEAPRLRSQLPEKTAAP